MVDFSVDVHATIAPGGVSCQDILLTAWWVHSWVRVVVTSPLQEPAVHLPALWKLAKRDKTSRRAPAWVLHVLWLRHTVLSVTVLDRLFSFSFFLMIKLVLDNFLHVYSAFWFLSPQSLLLSPSHPHNLHPVLFPDSWFLVLLCDNLIEIIHWSLVESLVNTQLHTMTLLCPESIHRK